MKPGPWIVRLSAGLLAMGGCRREDASHEPGAAVEQSVSDGGTTARLMLDHSRLTTAEQLSLTLEVTTPAGAAAPAPALRDDLGGFTAVDKRVGAPKLAPDGGVTASTTWVLEPFLPGDYTIPPIEVAYTRPDGSAGALTVPGVKIPVASVLPADQQDAADVGPARDVVDASVPAKGHAGAWIVGAGFLLGVGAAGTWWALRRHPRPAPDPCATAERRLQEIQGAPLGNPAAAVEEASSLLRTCLAHRLDPGAATRTTDELLASRALTSHLSEQDLGALRAGLEQSDAAKFAGTPVSEGAARAMMAETLGVIQTLSGIIALAPPSVAQGGRRDH